jgi:glycosyltransferase involved in cell wall biosynthesis
VKILHIDTEAGWRGGQNQLLHLVRGLKECGVQSFLVARAESDALQRIGPEVEEALALPSRKAWSPRAILSVIRFVKQNGIQVIDCHASNAHALGLMVKRFVPKVKLVVHRRVDYVPSGNFFSRRKYLGQGVDRFVAISEFTKKVLVEFGVDAQRIDVVRSAVPAVIADENERRIASESVREEFGIDSDVAILVTPAALTHQKGHRVLLRALGHLRERKVKVICLCAGEGPLLQELQQQAMALGIESYVRWLGFRNDVRRLLCGADILALPSNYEALGTVFLDGLYAGCVLAASDAGGIPEIIRPHVAGLRSPVGNAEELANNILRLIEAPDLRRELLTRGREHVQRHFSVEAMVRGNLEVYRSLL